MCGWNLKNVIDILMLEESILAYSEVLKCLFKKCVMCNANHSQILAVYEGLTFLWMRVIMTFIKKNYVYDHY